MTNLWDGADDGCRNPPDKPASPSAPSVGRLEADGRGLAVEMFRHWRGCAKDDIDALTIAAQAYADVREALKDLQKLHAACDKTLNDAKGQEADLLDRLHKAEQERDELRGRIANALL